MAKNSVTDWSDTPSNNTDIGGISIVGSADVKNFDNAFREMMAQVKTFSTTLLYKSGDTATGALNSNSSMTAYAASVDKVKLSLSSAEARVVLGAESTAIFMMAYDRSSGLFSLRYGAAEASAAAKAMTVSVTTNNVGFGYDAPIARVGISGNMVIGQNTEVGPGFGTTTVGLGFEGGAGRVFASAASTLAGHFNINANGRVVQFARSGSAVGGIDVTTTATTYTTSSDHRLKTDVEPIVDFALTQDQRHLLDGAILRVMEMRPVHYTWKAYPEQGTQTGFIAHELQEVAPHAVSGVKDAVIDVGTATTTEREIPVVFENVLKDQIPDATWVKTGTRPVLQGVDHGRLTPDLVAAMQGLTLMVLELRSRMDARDANGSL